MIKAVQQFQLGTVLKNEKRAKEVLFRMKESGYDGIELCGFMIRRTPFFVRLLTSAAGMPVGNGGLPWKELVAESGLKVVSVHEDLDRILSKTDDVVREANDFQTNNVVLTGVYNFNFTDAECLFPLIDRLNEAGRRLKENGINFLYHNHNVEFLKVNGASVYDVMLACTNPELVSFEFDSYWATEAGCDALALMKKLGSRMKLWHINDRGSKLKKKAITPIIQSDSMELGTGNLNLIPMVEQAKAQGIEAVILESYRNWIDGSPVKSFEVSARFLNEKL
ncbi:MAG: TIM barrel protein [Clostridia bacterium]|nr:TIM barrel protein [Clostridia bacterium]